MSPLRSRPVDLVYTIFFALHIPISLLLDFNGLYPEGFAPAAVSNLHKFYVEFSNDPLMIGLEIGKGSNELIWFKAFIWMEMVFQFPTFVLGIRGLSKGSAKIYPLLCVYGASTATTTLPCLLHVTKAFYDNQLSQFQFYTLLSGYIPFLLIPLFMAIDMAVRMYRIISKAEASVIKEKRS